MSYKFEVEGGNTVKFPVGGKYCDRDIEVTATGGGDVDLEDALVGGIAKETLTEYTNNRVTVVRDYIFNGFGSLQAVDLPNVEVVGAYAFTNTNLTEIYLPKCTTIGANAFQLCSALTKVDLPLLQVANSYIFSNDAMLSDVNMPLVTSIKRQAFYFCTGLEKVDFQLLNTIELYAFTNSRILATVIIRTPTVCSLDNVNAFTGTEIASGTGYVYVPAALVDSYKSATNWSTYAEQIRAIEDYPEITGTIGG